MDQRDPSEGCPYEPRELVGQPIGMLHCPECGCMVIAGLEHPACDIDFCQYGAAIDEQGAPLSESTLRTTLRRIGSDAILARLPEESDCVKLGDGCWALHPIHPSAYERGKVVQIEGDLTAIVETVIRALLNSGAVKAGQP